MVLSSLSLLVKTYEELLSPYRKQQHQQQETHSKRRAGPCRNNSAAIASAAAAAATTAVNPHMRVCSIAKYHYFTLNNGITHGNVPPPFFPFVAFLLQEAKIKAARHRHRRNRRRHLHIPSSPFPTPDTCSYRPEAYADNAIACFSASSLSFSAASSCPLMPSRSTLRPATSRVS